MRVFLCGIYLMLLSCASVPKQTEALLTGFYDGPSAHRIQNVPFIEQSASHCGPAALTMVLNYWQKTISLEEIAPQVYTPGMKGSFQTDMITAARRQGMMAIPISGLRDLLREIESGHPVIVFENLSVSWLPQWHYAVVFGYDLRQEVALMHSGPEKNKSWDLRKFERSWMLGDYWGLVVLPPDKLTATAKEIDHVKAAAALEELGKKEEAEKAYLRILKKWPHSLGALIGLGNIKYSENRTRQAEEYLTQATKSHPNSAIAWHNLTIAFAANGKSEQAKKSASEALKYASPAEKNIFAENLKTWTN